MSKSRLNAVFKEQNITRKAVQLLLLKALGLGKTINKIDGSMKLVNGSLSTAVSWLNSFKTFLGTFFFAQVGEGWLDPGSSSLGILEAGKGSKRRSR